MKITQYDQNGICVIELEGRIDVNGAEELNQTLAQSVESGQYRIVLDMNNVQYLNTSGLHMLAEIQTRNQQQGGDLRLARLSPIVQRVFQIVGFRRFFRNYSSVESAIMGL